MNSLLQQLIDEEPRIDMTPFLDVIFLLMIFMMLQKYRTYEGRFLINLPYEQLQDTRSETKFETIQIQLTKSMLDKHVVLQAVKDNDQLFKILIPRNKKGKVEAFNSFQRNMLNCLNDIPTNILEIQCDPKIEFDFVALLIRSIHSVKDNHEHDLQKAIYLAKKTRDKDLLQELENKVIKISFSSLRKAAEGYDYKDVDATSDRECR